MFDIQHPDDWEAFQKEYEERKEILEQMARQNYVIMAYLDEKELEEVEGLLIPNQAFVASWKLKEDDPDIVGETLSFILADSEWEESEV